MDYIDVDKRGRCSLGKHSQGHDRFRVIPNDDGSLLLVPVKQLDELEMEFVRRPELRAELEKSIAQAEAGMVRTMGTVEEELARFGLNPER